MKVLFVAHSADLSGGANRSLISLVKGLRENWKIDPSILVPAAGGELQRECEKEKISVYVGKYHTCCTVFQHELKDILRCGKLIAAPIVDWFYARKLNRQLPDDFDLVYTNERMVVVGAYLAAMRKRPHIWHVRSFGRENSTYYPPFYYRLMDRSAQRIILISEALKDTFAKKINCRKLRMIYNGINFDDYSIKTKIPHEKCRLLLTGRIVPPKGQIEAVQALEIIQRIKPDRFELFFAGSVPQYDAGDYDHQLSEYIRKSGLQNQVHFLGDVQDMRELRRNIDIELVCSWCETFGRVTIEAMCAKIPVIGSNSGGTAEIVVDRQTGLLYPPHDAEKLAECILWCEEHPKETAKMTETGYQRAKEYFTIDNTVKNIYSVISETCLKEKR